MSDAKAYRLTLGDGRMRTIEATHFEERGAFTVFWRDVYRDGSFVQRDWLGSYKTSGVLSIEPWTVARPGESVWCVSAVEVNP